MDIKEEGTIALVRQVWTEIIQDVKYIVHILGKSCSFWL
jgi:hypothetical protein